MFLVVKLKYIKKGKIVNETIVQPYDLLKGMNITPSENNIKILSTCFSLLNSLRIGDTFETSTVGFTRISEDLIYIKTDVTASKVMEALEENKVIRLPI